MSELYLPPDAQEPISISLPWAFFPLKFKFVSTQKPEYYARPLTMLKFVLTWFENFPLDSILNKSSISLIPS